MAEVEVVSELPRHFAKVPLPLLEHPDSRPNHIALFAALYSLVDWRDGGADGLAARDVLMGRAGFTSRKQLYAARDWLHQHGFARWVERDGQPTLYTLTVPVVHNVPNPAPNRGHRPDGPGPESGTGAAPNRGQVPGPESGPLPEQPQTPPETPLPSASTEPEVSDSARDLTRRFARAVNANGHPLPNRGTQAHRKWLEEMDRLLRLGPPGEGGHVPDAAEVARVIDWCAADTGDDRYPGEATNVRAVPKFRARYSELRRKALNANGHTRRPSDFTNVTTDDIAKAARNG